jgi:hypothetical protein
LRVRTGEKFISGEQSGIYARVDFELQTQILLSNRESCARKIWTLAKLTIAAEFSLSGNIPS